jgi:hypothetical protein
MTESQKAFDAYITSGLFGENKAVRSNELTWHKEKYSADIARDFKLWQAAEAYGRKQALEEAVAEARVFEYGGTNVQAVAIKIGKAIKELIK